jgi:hypothetical protein
MQKVIEEITNDNHKWQIVPSNCKLIDYRNVIFFYNLDFWIWYLIHKKWKKLGWKIFHLTFFWSLVTHS